MPGELRLRRMLGAAPVNGARRADAPRAIAWWATARRSETGPSGLRTRASHVRDAVRPLRKPTGARMLGLVERAASVGVAAGRHIPRPRASRLPTGALSGWQPHSGAHSVIPPDSGEKGRGRGKFCSGALLPPRWLKTGRSARAPLLSGRCAEADPEAGSQPPTLRRDLIARAPGTSARAAARRSSLPRRTHCTAAWVRPARR